MYHQAFVSTHVPVSLNKITAIDLFIEFVWSDQVWSKNYHSYFGSQFFFLNIKYIIFFFFCFEYIIEFLNMRILFLKILKWICWIMNMLKGFFCCCCFVLFCFLSDKKLLFLSGTLHCITRFSECWMNNISL